jgi:hypothetical protein
MPRLSRRHFCAAAGAFLSKRAWAVNDPPIQSARAFVESVGVCVHIAAEPYSADFPRFRDLLHTSGIRHIREELRPADDVRRWHELQEAAGVRWHLLASPTTNTVQQALQRVAELGHDHVSAVEGQNEGDAPWFTTQGMVHGDWSGAVIAYQRNLYRAFRQLYTAATLPVVSPTLLDWRPRDVGLIEDAAPFCDIVALHAYVQHAQEPETDMPNAALSWYIQNYLDPFKPGAPMMVTEAGYTNVVAPGGRGLSPRAVSIYVPRLLLHNFASGALRTFLYEFMDGGSDPANTEHHYGLIQYDGTPKPAYHAIRSLLWALQDQGDRGSSRAINRGLELSFADAPQDLRHLRLAMRDGRIVLALWRPLRSWDIARGEDVAVPQHFMSVIPSGGAISAELLVPNDDSRWSILKLENGRIRVPVSDRVALLRVTDHGV